MTMKHLFKFLSQRPVAANIAHMLGTAFNGDAITSDEWVKISPYGEFPIVIKGARYMQHVDRAQADKMVAAFNSVLSRLGRLFRGAPIFVGHPDQDPQTYADHARRGEFEQIEAREDGLWGKPAWNDLGRKNLEEGYFVYPSPAWRFPRPRPGQSTIFPDELVSVGLTNTPNIDLAEPVTNDANPGDDEQTANTTNMKKLHALLNVPEEAGEDGLLGAINKIQGDHQAANARIKSIFGKIRAACNEGGVFESLGGSEEKELEGDTTSSNDAVLDSVLLAINGLLKTGKESATQLTAANARITALNTARVNDELDRAINDGRITKADRTTHETALNADFDAGRTALLALNSSLNTRGIEIGKQKVDITTEAQRRDVIANAVEEHMRDHHCDYMTAFNAIKNDKRFTAVFEAMNKKAS